MESGPGEGLVTLSQQVFLSWALLESGKQTKAIPTECEKWEKPRGIRGEGSASRECS